MTPGAGSVAWAHWHLGFNDPSAAGWAIFTGYFLASALCIAAARHSRQPDRPCNERRVRLFWRSTAILLALLGANKQLDLQTLLTDIGREAARSGGWYGQHRSVQAFFVAGLCVLGIALLAATGLLLRRSLMPIWGAIAGITVLGCFVLIRAASFHHVDQALGMSLAGLRLQWLIEALGIALIAASAGFALRHPRTPSAHMATHRVPMNPQHPGDPSERPAPFP